MDDYGLITIDNRNLLDDLLGLSEQDENPSQLNRQQFDYSRPRQMNNYNNSHSSKLLDSSRKVYLESPTFTKKEDDIYRYVHSRLSSVDQTITNNPHQNVTNDSLVDTNNSQFILNNEKAASKIRLKNTQPQPLLPQPLIRTSSNRLLSDIAVASLPKNNLLKNSRSSLDDQFYENDLLDSLDAANPNSNFYLNPNNNINPYLNNNQASNHNFNQQFNQQPFLIDTNQSPQSLYQQHQQIQQHLLQQQQQQQQLQLLPFHQQPKPGSVFTILPSPTAATNSIPLVQSSLQFQPTPPAPQFFPIPIPASHHPYLAAQQGQNMFVQEPMQPMFYNSSYPINMGGAGGPLQNANNYFNQSNDYDSYPYQQADYYHQNNINNNQYLNNHPQQHNNLNGNKYDAQPLQPPPQMGTPRNVNKINHNNNNINAKNMRNQPDFRQKNLNEYDSPDSEDNADLNNEFGLLKVFDKNKAPLVNNNNNKITDLSDDDQKRQEVWNKLQNANRKENSKNLNSSQSKSNGLPPVVSTKSSVKQKTPAPFIDKKQESNFLEKNVDAIRNKENLTHRYPEKKYEAFYGKNIEQRLKYFQGSDKKPPQQLHPIENYERGDDFKTISLDINTQEDLYSSKKITIPIKPGMIKDKDHINLDINLRLIDFLPQNNSNRNRSFDDFEVDPFNQHIKKFESMSRSLPGSSGSLNKLKPLPPVNQRRTAVNPSNHENRHDHDQEEGYLAQLQKAHNRPVIKTYTLKDYRNFKKDAIPTSSTMTGKLGPDFENETYRQKVEITQKKTDYAERVKARNRLILAEQKKNEEDESIKSTSHQSKTQRAKDYARNNIIRPKSSSRPISNELENESQVKFIATDRSLKQGKSRLDLNKQRSLDKAIVRIRDPVTSKVRTLYLSDDQLDDLSQRHEQEKNKIKSILANNENNNNNNNNDNNTNNSNQNGKSSPTKTDNQSTSLNQTKNTSILNSLSNQPHHHNSNNGLIIKNHKMPVDLGRSKIMDEYDRQKAEDEEFLKMMERHKAEKNKVNQFDGPYVHEELQETETNLINNANNQISVE